MLKSHKSTTLCQFERTYIKICYNELKILRILILTVIYVNLTLFYFNILCHSNMRVFTVQVNRTNDVVPAF